MFVDSLNLKIDARVHVFHDEILFQPQGIKQLHEDFLSDVHISYWL